MVGGSPVVVPENIYTHPRKVNKNSKREGGFKCTIFVKKSMTHTKLEFLEWWVEVQTKKPSMVGYGYFVEQHTLHNVVEELKSGLQRTNSDSG